MLTVPKIQEIIDSVGYCLCAVATFLITYQTLLAASVVRKSGEVMAIVPIPVYLFMYVLVFGAGLLCLAFVVDLCGSVGRAINHE